MLNIVGYYTIIMTTKYISERNKALNNTQGKYGGLNGNN